VSCSVTPDFRTLKKMVGGMSFADYSATELKALYSKRQEAVFDSEVRYAGEIALVAAGKRIALPTTDQRIRSAYGLDLMEFNGAVRSVKYAGKKTPGIVLMISDETGGQRKILADFYGVYVVSVDKSGEPSEEAERSLMIRLLNKVVRFECIERVRRRGTIKCYGRFHLDATWIDKEIVASGLARAAPAVPRPADDQFIFGWRCRPPEKPDPHLKELREAEAGAKRRKAGIWNR
jgi:hypothetical protein